MEKGISQTGYNAFRCVSNYVDAKTSAPFALQHTIHPPLASLHSIQLILKTGSSSNSSSWIFTYVTYLFFAHVLCSYPVLPHRP